MKALLLALGFLTRLPVPRVAAGPEEFGRAVRLYPIAGTAIGAVVAAAFVLGGRVDPWLGALAGTIAWVWVTGALHLDGLGDMADGLGAAHGDRTRLLAVMADPHVGSFGVVAIVLQLAAKLVLLRLVPPSAWPVLLAVPAAARLGPLAWAYWLRPLRPGGLGAMLAGAVGLVALATWAIMLAAAAWFLPALWAAPLVIGALALWFRYRVGGVTGDVHGAGIELTETGLLLAVVIQAAV